MDALQDPQVLESLPAVLAALAVLGSIVGGAIGLLAFVALPARAP